MILAERFPLRILIAEDNLITQKLILHILQKMGYTAEAVENGLEVLNSLKRQHYDLILMDIQMPGMDGFETTRQIITNWTVDKRPRIIGITANTLENTKQRCLEAGMDDYTSKPILIEDLQEILERWGQTLNALPDRVAKEETNTNSLVDPYVINQLRELSRETRTLFLEDLIRLFLEQAPPFIDQIKQSARIGDAPILSKAAHELKNMGLNLGAETLSNICTAIEKKGRTEDFSQIDSLIEKLEKTYEQTCVKLKDIKV
jgi:CheY-like chemotaxis protein/HPt (histidine-containing phosphotransfer) domain-containing protein